MNRTRSWFPLCLRRGGVALLALGLILLAGCSRFESGVEPLPDSTFTRLLIEFQLAAARQEIKAPYPSGLRDSILAGYGVSEARFDSTLRYYSHRPKALRTLYEGVIDSLRSLQYGESGTMPSDIRDSLAQRAR